MRIPLTFGVQSHRHSFVLALIAFLAASVTLYGQTDESAFAGRNVVAVRYDPPVQPIDARDLKRMQLVQESAAYNPREVAATLDRFFSTGLYDDLKVNVETSGTGVVVTFITKARRFIGHVGAQGNISDPPNRAVIISDAQLYLGTPYDEDALETARKNVKQQMERNGLYEAKVNTATIIDPDTNQVTIRFLVDAGRRATYTTPIIHGDTKLPAKTIIRATGWRVPLINRWRQITQSLTDKGTEGIEQRYAKNNRLTAVADLQSLDYDPDTHRATPTLDITAGPKVTIKALEAKVSKSVLRKYIPVYQEGSVDNDLLTEGARNLHDYFQSRGYPDVDVAFRRDPPEHDQQTINYYITTGPRRRLVNVEILGNDYFSSETLQERMFLRPSSLLLRYGRYSESFRKKDEEAITGLYVSNGFRDARVTSSVTTGYKGKENDLSARFRINPGQQWLVESLQVQGSNRLNLAPLERDFTSASGQPYADVNVATDRNLILNYYYSNGFPNASFSYTSVPGTQPQTVKLIYQVREGPRQFVRGVIVSGLYRTHPSLVEKRLNLESGEPLSMVKVNNVARQLSDLGVFASVNTAIQDQDGTNLYKTVLFDLDEAGRYTFNIGFGLQVGQFGNTTNNLSNAGGSKGISPIIAFDVSRLNFLGSGQTISLQTRYSTLEQREALNYVVPHFLGSFNRTVTFSALYSTTQDVQTFSSKRLEASVQTSQRFNRASTALLRFAYRRVSTGNINIPSLLIPSLLQPVRIGILSGSYIQDHRDNPADAHTGFWNTVDAGITGSFFGSQRSFYRVLARNATYTQIGRKFVLARQTQLGGIIPYRTTPGLTSFESIPLPERFFGGGGVSMRGVGDNQAGPRDIGTVTEQPGAVTATPTGFPIGGNGLFFNNIELRFPLAGPNISGVFFHDMGNIYSNFGDISLRYRQRNDQDFNYAVQAVGFGIRYKTPLGPVRVDLAYSLNPPAYQGFSTNLTTQDLLACTPSQIGVTPNCTASGQRLSHFQFFFSIGQAF